MKSETLISSTEQESTQGSRTSTAVWPGGRLAPYLAEGIGTFGLVFAGCGAIMIDALSTGTHWWAGDQG